MSNPCKANPNLITKILVENPLTPRCTLFAGKQITPLTIVKYPLTPRCTLLLHGFPPGYHTKKIINQIESRPTKSSSYRYFDQRAYSRFLVLLPSTTSNPNNQVSALIENHNIHIDLRNIHSNNFSPIWVKILEPLIILSLLFHILMVMLISHNLLSFTMFYLYFLLNSIFYMIIL